MMNQYKAGYLAGYKDGHKDCFGMDLKEPEGGYDVPEQEFEDRQVDNMKNDAEVAYLQGKMAFFNGTDLMEYGGRFPEEFKGGFIDAQVEKLEED